MPVLPLASLISNLASNVVEVAAHAADAGNTKGTLAKPSDKEKKSPDAASLASAFAACLAAAAAVAPPGTPAAAAKTQKAPIRSANGVPGIAVAASATPGSTLKTADAAAKTSPTSLAAATAIKRPTPPAAPARSTLAAAAPLAAPAAPVAVHAGRASSSAASTTATASVPALKQEGKGEIHLGSHTLVDSPVTETATSASDPSAADPPVPARPAPSASELQEINGASGAAVAVEAPASPRQSTENIRLAEEAPRSSPEQAQEMGPQRGVSALGSEQTRLAALSRPRQTSGGVSASNGTQTLASGTSAATNRGDSRTQGDANSSAPNALLLPDVGVVVAPNTTTPSGGSTSLPSPVADQLTQAFLAHANVAQQTGRTDIHLSLDPPRLGAVRIHLTATQHTVSAHLVVAHEGTRQLLENQASHLRQGLAEAGLSLGSFDVAQDGSGGRGGEQQPPPQTPLPPPTAVSTTRTTTVVSTSVSRPTDGINILA